MNQNFINAQGWATSYLDYWEKAVTEWQKSVLKYSEDFTTTYKSFIEKCTQGNFFTAYNDLCNDAFGKTFTVQGDQVAQDTYNRITEIAELYTNLFKSFVEFSTTKNEDLTGNLQGFLGNWVETQKNLYNKMFGVSFPTAFMQEGDISKFVGSAFETYRKMFSDTIQYLPENMKPIVKDYMSVIEKSGSAIDILKSPEKLGEIQESWRKIFDESVSQFTNVISNGYTEKVADNVKKDADSFLKYITSTADVFTKIYRPGLETIEQSGKKAGEILKDGSPESLKKFYEHLLKNLETGFFGFFKSNDFNTALRTNFDSFLDFRTRHFEMLESMLHMNPVFAEQVKSGTDTPKATTKPKTGKIKK
ncbi:MAG: hypothetical protein ACYS8W_07945 [Planctomycetota bacterium]|jgi:hypothetical protein